MTAAVLDLTAGQERFTLVWYTVDNRVNVDEILDVPTVRVHPSTLVVLLWRHQEFCA